MIESRGRKASGPARHFLSDSTKQKIKNTPIRSFIDIFINS